MNLYQKKGEYDEMEYIAREALFEQLKAMESYNTSPMYRRGYDDCVATVLNAPAADVVPVVHGRWLHSGCEECSGLEVVKCSECNHEAFAIAFYVCNGNYCPSCGARMDGGADNG